MANQINNNQNNGGIGFLGLLTILFIGLKLTGYITWSWVWVLSPLWIGFAVALALFVIIFVVAFVAEMFK